jgi:hypothetical protein
MQYEIKQGQSIYDVAVLLYGDATYAVKLCNDNDLQISSTDFTGVVVNYNEALKKFVLRPQIFIPKVVDDNYLVRQQQSTYDLAIMFNYGIDNFAEFLQTVGLEASEINAANTTIQVTKQSGNVPLGVTFATLFDGVFVPPPPSYILMEDGSFILMEDNSKILME